jgi:hypothetical protein
VKVIGNDNRFSLCDPARQLATCLGPQRNLDGSGRVGPGRLQRLPADNPEEPMNRRRRGVSFSGFSPWKAPFLVKWQRFHHSKTKTSGENWSRETLRERAVAAIGLA